MKPEEIAQLRLLLAAVARKDAVAFGQLYQATASKLFAFSLRILVRRELAEEALQEIFVAVWNNASSYNESMAAPMTWMVTVARNKCFDMLRRRSGTEDQSAAMFEQDMLDTLESDDPNPAEQVERRDEARALARCMDGLERLHREAIILAWFQDMSHSEVAAQLKLPVGTVKTWIRRGMDKLRTCLSEWERG